MKGSDFMAKAIKTITIIVILVLTITNLTACAQSPLAANERKAAEITESLLKASNSGPGEYTVEIDIFTDRFDKAGLVDVVTNVTVSEDGKAKTRPVKEAFHDWFKASDYSNEWTREIHINAIKLSKNGDFIAEYSRTSGVTISESTSTPHS